jgi:serine/threonine protein kinase
MERLPMTLADALYGSLNKPAVQMSVLQRLSIAHGVASGLRFCHAHNPPVVHRDLKPSNVLLSEDLRRVKLCDFGSARALADAASLTIGVGTVQYTAPEVLNPPDDACAVQQYDAKVDVFSFGILLWELFAGTKPYANLNAAQVPMAVCARNMRPSPDPASLPEAMVGMMKRCWHANAAHRPTMAEVAAALGQELTSAESAAQQAAADRNDCVVCADEQRSTALVPCGHVCCCADCAADLHECPICRQAVRERVKLFHA